MNKKFSRFRENEVIMVDKRNEKNKLVVVFIIKGIRFKTLNVATNFIKDKTVCADDEWKNNNGNELAE